MKHEYLQGKESYETENQESEHTKEYVCGRKLKDRSKLKRPEFYGLTAVT